MVFKIVPSLRQGIATMRVTPRVSVVKVVIIKTPIAPGVRLEAIFIRVLIRSRRVAFYAAICEGTVTPWPTDPGVGIQPEIIGILNLQGSMHTLQIVVAGWIP
jgi:hypothetical protein